VLAKDADTIDFRSLACGISVFSNDPQEKKVQAAFHLYDTNGDGVISMEEMVSYFTCVFSVLYALDPSKEAAMGGVPADELAKMTSAQAFADADKDGNGELTFEEFRAWYSQSPSA
jgi:Ca2+-binding EF-hand superfamily protein